MGKEFWEQRKEIFLQKLLSHIKRFQLSIANDEVLIVGASLADLNIMTRAGFKNITLSNISADFTEELGEKHATNSLFIDAENIDLADQSYDVLFAYEVLHHCRSPHRCLCEMLRVAKKHVIICEPNDSFLMSMLIKFGLSFPYEIPAVVDNNFINGGVRNTCVPNYIYRWNSHEVFKTASAFLAEYVIESAGYSYWDLTLDEERLMERDQTNLVGIAKVIGPGNFLKLLKVAEAVLNRIPLVKTQGNKFFSIISKTQQLHPWLIAADGAIRFNQESI